MNVAWTGHRPDLFAAPDDVASTVADLAAALRARYGADLTFHCGGQRGVDTWAAIAARRLGVPLHLYLPLPPDQFAADWSPDDVRALDASWAYAVARTVVDPAAAPGELAYRERNRLLASQGERLIALWTGLGGGGTAETIALARALGRPVEEHRFAPSGQVPRPGERGV